MKQEQNQRLKKILGFTAWTALGICCTVLLIAAVSNKSAHTCKDVQVKIEGVKNNFFVDENAVLELFNKIHPGSVKGRRLDDFKLAEMESALEKNAWIKNAEVYFDNNDILQVKVFEREPVARIFATNGSSFYLDSSLAKLPLNPGYSARIPVFTGYVAPIKKTSKSDSLFLRNISDISSYILADAFWMAQVDQVDIGPGNTFELVPKIGNQEIYFGSAENFESKFENLLLFYNQVLTKVGWNKYRSLNLGFNGQVVAVKRGVNEIKQDSLQTLQLMKALALKAQKDNQDSTQIQLEQNEYNRIPMAQPTDDNLFEGGMMPKETINIAADEQPKLVSIVTIPEVNGPSMTVKNNLPTIKPQSQKRIVKTSAKTPVKNQPKMNKAIAKPKAVMKPVNDY